MIIVGYSPFKKLNSRLFILVGYGRSFLEVHTMTSECEIW